MGNPSDGVVTESESEPTKEDNVESVLVMLVAYMLLDEPAAKDRDYERQMVRRELRLRMGSVALMDIEDFQERDRPLLLQALALLPESTRDEMRRKD